MYKLALDVVWAEAEHGAVLLHERTGRYWQMNDTAVVALRCILDGGSVTYAATLLSTNFANVDADQAATDTHSMLERLLDAGLVTS